MRGARTDPILAPEARVYTDPEIFGIERTGLLSRGWYAPGGDENETLRKLAPQDLETTVAEDIDLVESVPRRFYSRDDRSGLLEIDPKRGVNSKHPVLHLQTGMREVVDG